MADWSVLLAAGGIGAVAGLLGGMLGIGGGVVIVPALVILLEASTGIPGQTVTLLAVGTSLATIVFTSASAAYAQVKRGAVNWEIVKNWVLFVLLGAALAGVVAAALPAWLLRGFIGVFLLVVAIIMLRAWRPNPHRAMPNGVGNAVTGGAIGLVSGMAGIGGGNVMVPTMSYFNVPIHTATATSSTLGVPIALFGALGYIVSGWGDPATPSVATGYVHWPLAAAITVVSVITAPIGVAVAHRLPADRLKRVFGLLLLLVSARMIYTAALSFSGAA